MSSSRHRSNLVATSNSRRLRCRRHRHRSGKGSGSRCRLSNHSSGCSSCSSDDNSKLSSSSSRNASCTEICLRSSIVVDLEAWSLYLFCLLKTSGVGRVKVSVLNRRKRELDPQTL